MTVTTLERAMLQEVAGKSARGLAHSTALPRGAHIDLEVGGSRGLSRHKI